MNIKARIGLAIAVVATALSLVFAIAAIAVEESAPDPSPESAVEGCVATFSGVDGTVTRTFSGSCPATQAQADATCTEATARFNNLAKNTCIKFQGKECRNAPFAPPGSGTVSCTNNPGYVSKNVKCEFIKDAKCLLVSECNQICETRNRDCITACGNNAACKQGCQTKFEACRVACNDP